MSRESDDNLSSINSAYTDLYQETVKRFTRSSLSPTSDWDRFSPARRSLKSTSTTPSTTTTSTYDYYLEATGRRRSSDHNSAVLTANTEQFIIGQRVWVGGLRSGQIAYIGETHFAPGDWAGIVLDEPNGKNDGCVSGKRYFQCEPKRGIFSRLTRLTTYPLSGAQTPTSPMAKNSPERSRTVSPTASVRSSMLRSPGIGKNGLTVGDRVIVSSGFGSRPGILRYLGETQFAPGNWCGVELDEASGKNDGAVDGIRYFECKPKYGVFVPIAKVSLSPSTKKTRLSRTGSRESLTSIGTMNSIATTNTSRMRMNAQRKSTTPIKPIVTTPKSQFSMQDLLREKQNHVEQLMVERDLDREDAQNQALQLQKNINELKARIVQLESQLSEERKKSEELQFSIDEAQFCGDELNAQSQVYKEKIHDLESKITQLVSATPSLQSIPIPTEDSAALANSQLKITELQEKLITQEKLSEARSAEQLEEEQRLRENVKYLQAQIETLQKELVGKDESLEKFSLSQCGIENLRTELALLKEENEKQAREAEAIYEQKLQAKSEELQQVTNELQKLKSASDSLESERANVSDECEILQTEIRMRDEQIKELSQQLDELTTQLQVQKADSSALDEMLKQQQTGGEEKGAQLKKNIEEIGQLKIEVESSKLKKQELEKELEQTKQETEKDKEILAQQLKEIEQLKANNTELDQELVAKNTELESALKEQQSVKSQLETITEIIAKKDLELKELGQSLVDLNLQLKEKTENCDELLANLDQAKQNAQKSLADKEKELKEAQSQVQKTEESLKLIQNQLEQQQQLSAASGEEGAKQLATLQEEINKVKSQEKELQSALGQSQSELASKIKLLEATNGNLEKLTQTLEDIKKQLAESEEQVKLSSEKYSKKDLQLGDLQRQHEALQGKCDSLNQQQETLQTELVAARSSSSQLQATLKQLNDDLLSELQAERTSSNELNSKLLKVSEQISTGQKDLAHQTDVWTKEKLQIESEVQELKQQLQSSQANQEKIQGERQKLETLLQNSQDELAKIQAEQVQLTSGTQETIKDLQERLDITNQDLQHKEQMAREDAQKITDLKTLVEAIQVSNANISATNAELSTILEILQAEKSETAHIFELFEMEADMNAERLIEKLTGMKQELKETHLQLETEQTKYKDLESQLEKLNQSEKNLNEAALDSAEQLRQLQQANGELQDLFKEKQESFAQLEKTLGDTNAQLADQQEKFKQLQQQEMNSHKESTKFSEELEQIQQVREELLKSVQQKEELNQKLESKLKESSDTIKTHQVTCDELQQKLEKLQQKERELLDESTKSKEQLQQLQSANEELQKSLQQKQILLEKGNEFEDRLAEYQKVIDEMDEASSIKTTNIEQLNKRIHDLEMGLQQTIQAHNASQEECKQLSRQLQSLELEKAREVATLKAQVNGTNNASQGQGDEVALADTEISLAKINFLNSIIADMQQKNDALKAKVQTLETLPTDFTKPHAFDMLAKRKPAPRLFCDICDEFDKHETEDCPLQASDDLDDSPPPASEANNNENKERKLPAPRKYCESCEVFGHDTSECADEETY
ncbi:uncharacterized protein Dwil_GK24176, isoform C [Drosophila willistoni]|uniref:Uncharacterized protein, isoform C n=1 Tax=Drosophila willistoni TaxID=7260 RepID=B4N1B5_DROWI|nr:uncharacterized protein Dwil_GK24176, isoform C [Drosophila willistoni]